MPLDYIDKDDLYKLIEEHPHFKRTIEKDIEVVGEQTHFKRAMEKDSEGTQPSLNHYSRIIYTKQKLDILFAQIRLAQSLDTVVQDTRELVWLDFLKKVTTSANERLLTGK